MLPGRTHAVLAVCIFTLYWGIAFSVGEFYPVSPLGMGSTWKEYSSRVVARLPEGELREVSDYTRWNCGVPIRIGGNCMPESYNSLDDALGGYIAEHEGPPGGSQKLELVRIIYRIPELHAPVEVSYCKLYE